MRGTFLLCLVAATASWAETPAELASRLARTGTTDESFEALAHEVPGFGGLFITDGRVHVYLTNLTAASPAIPLLRLYVAEVNPEGPPAHALEFEFLQATYDFPSLRRMFFSLADAFAVPGVVSLDIDERLNRIAVGIESPTAQAAVEQHVVGTTVPLAAVRIKKDERSQTKASLLDFWRPTRGGNEIHSVGNGTNQPCTQTLNVVRAGVPGFITCSHCSVVEGATDGYPFYQPSTAFPPAVGTETFDPPFSPGLPGCGAGQICRHSDSTFTATPGQALYSRILRPTMSCTLPTIFCSTIVNPTTPEFFIVGAGPVPVIGANINKVGRTTGWSAGQVTEVCQTRQQFTPFGVFTLLCQYRASMASVGGDSGSPMFVLSGGTGNVLFSGILWGGPNSQTTDFSALNSMTLDLGAFSF